MDELRNLNNLNRGIHKRWIWENKDNFYRSCDYYGRKAETGRYPEIHGECVPGRRTQNSRDRYRPVSYTHLMFLKVQLRELYFRQIPS